MALVYDPKKQIYAQSSTLETPELDTPESELGQAQEAESYFDPAKATVAGQMETLQSKSNPLKRMAVAQTQRGAQGRGLLNTQMAGTAGTAASLQSDMPIAQQDAALYGSFGKADQEVSGRARLNLQEADLAQQRAEDNAALTGALQGQAFEHGQKSDFLKGKIAQDFKEFSFKFDESLLNTQLKSNEKIAVNNAMSAQTQTLMSNIGMLLNNPDIEMGDDVPSWMSEFMYSGWESTSSLFGLDIKVA